MKIFVHIKSISKSYLITNHYITNLNNWITTPVPLCIHQHDKTGDFRLFTSPSVIHNSRYAIYK